MRTVLKVGYHYFLLPPSANLGAVLKALGEAIPVNRKYDIETHKDIYYPDEGVEISTAIIRIDQLRMMKAAARGPLQLAPPVPVTVKTRPVKKPALKIPGKVQPMLLEWPAA